MSSTARRITRNVKLLMVTTDTKQADLARRAGMSESQLSRLLAGKRAWGLDHMESIAGALNVSVSDLLAEADELLKNRCFSAVVDQLELFANTYALTNV
jgi:transcriptional regulator with XRE-family HTH domain